MSNDHTYGTALNSFRHGTNAIFQRQFLMVKLYDLNVASDS